MIVFCIIYSGDVRISDFIIKCNISYGPPSFKILLIAETWMVNILYSLTFTHDLFAYWVEVSDFSREPWYFRRGFFSNFCGYMSDVLYSILNIVIFVRTFHMYFKLKEFLTLNYSCRFRLYTCEVNVIVIEYCKNSMQNPWLIRYLHYHWCSITHFPIISKIYWGEGFVVRRSRSTLFFY